MKSTKTDEELKDLLYPIISPESFENSNMKNILSENLSFTLDEIFSLIKLFKSFSLIILFSIEVLLLLLMNKSGL